MDVLTETAAFDITVSANDSDILHINSHFIRFSGGVIDSLQVGSSLIRLMLAK